jgi:hypothetical protein
MASDVDICNLALHAIGHTKGIGALTVEDSEEAAACLVQYAQCRDEVLEDAEWPFATRRSAPAALDGTTLDLGAVPDEWTYAFALPADCVPNGLRRISVGVRNLSPGQEPKFVVEYDGTLQSNVVFTDEKTPEFVYTARITNTALFSPAFVRALAARIAVELIPALRKDLSKVDGQWKLYQFWLGKAKSKAKSSEKPDTEPLPPQIAGRF